MIKYELCPRKGGKEGTNINVLFLRIINYIHNNAVVRFVRGYLHFVAAVVRYRVL